MNGQQPDPATIDAMLQQYDEDDDHEAWAWMATSPAAEEEWYKAQQRRRDIDALAAILCKHEWLAIGFAAIRKLRSFAHDPGFQVLVGKDVLTATLGDERALDMTWGRTKRVACSVGEIVTVNMPASVSAHRVFYRTASAQGELPEASWTLESGEAPVLIVAVLDALAVVSLDEALAVGSAAAAVVIVEE